MDVFAEFNKIHEAFCVRNAIPVDRKHTDDDLTPTMGALILAEAQLARLPVSDEADA